MNCIGNPPGIGWVCQDGGWLPPGHPAIRNPPPPPPPLTIADVQPPPVGASINLFPCPGAEPGPNHELVQCAHAGITLPSGDYFFEPPLVLRDTMLLQGNRTALRPLTTAPGPLIIVEKTQGGDYSIGYPLPTQFKDLRIVGFPGQIAVIVRGGVITFERVTICNATIGVRFDWAVNVAFRDCLITGCNTGALLHGLPGVNSITTLRFSNTRFARNTLYGVQVHHGMGVVFDDSSVVEGNEGTGLAVHPSGEVDIIARDLWFEANGRHVDDPRGRITYEGARRLY